MHFVGIDIGSSSIKGATLDCTSLSIGPVRQVPFVDPIPGLPPGHFEVEPLQVVERVGRLLSELLHETPRCDGVLVCGQMGGVVLATPDGQPLTNYFSWRDQRVLAPHPTESGSYLDVAGRRLGSHTLRQLGQELRAGSAEIAAIRKALPQSKLTAAERDKAMQLVATAGKFGGTYAAARLTGMAARQAASLGALMNTRGLTELIVLNLALEKGVISDALFAMLVIMALVTTFITSPLLHLLLRRHPWISTDVECLTPTL